MAGAGACFRGPRARLLPLLLLVPLSAALTPTADARSVVLPWIAQTRGGTAGSSDLHLLNPGSEPIEVTLEFRKRGVPETTPPQATRVLGPGATLHSSDVLAELFDREDLSGFLLVTASGETEPVATSLDSTGAAGARFGQLVPGVVLPPAGTPPRHRVQHLVGLGDDGERSALLGIDNPTAQPAVYRLRFFDSVGKPLAGSGELTLGPFRQRQLQPQELRERFGVARQAEYRVEIETHAGGPLVPFAIDMRASTGDRSFVSALVEGSPLAYVVGTSDARGIRGSHWRTDLLLANPSSEPMVAHVSFTGPGFRAAPTAPLRIDLEPGATERVQGVVALLLGDHDGSTGVLTVQGGSSGEGLPLVRAETYDVSDPARRFGTSVAARNAVEAAPAGSSQVLVGLRQDASSRTVLWLFNPDSTQARYEVVYRALDGSALGVIGVTLPAGKMRQISPSQHPVPSSALAAGFTVQVEVKTGKALAAAQVVNNHTNDPAYVQGETR